MPSEFCVPIIHQGLEPSETLFQILNALESLDDIVQNVFGRISNKLSDEKERIANVNTRIQKAQNKINIIASNRSNATTIISPAKYAAPDNLSDFGFLFNCLDSSPKLKICKETTIQHSNKNIIATLNDLKTFETQRNEDILSSIADPNHFSKEKKR